MKLRILLFLSFTVLFACDKATETQTVKIDGRYQMDLPAHMTKATGLNDAASLQYQNAVKEFYAIVIDEPKAVLEQSIFDNNLEGVYSNDLNGYAKLITEGMKNNATLDSLPPLKLTKINGLEARTIDVTGKIQNIRAYWKVAYVEGKSHYYQIMVWTLEDKKEQFEAHMDAAINSFKETDRSGAK